MSEQIQTGVANKVTNDPYTAAQFNGLNNAINHNATTSQGKLTDQRAINTLADIADLLDSGTYKFTAGNYHFNKSISFAGVDVLFTDLDGCYEITSNCIATISYSGTTPFFTMGATGQVVTLGPIRITTPNATAFEGILGGNSFISNFGIFIDCKKMVNLEGWDFFTVDAFAGAGCETGCTLNDVVNINISKPQWNAGQDLGGCMFAISGANSERIICDAVNSQPAASEAFFDIQASFGGEGSITTGVHTTGAGDFFKPGSRDQSDVSIFTAAVKNVPSSIVAVGGYVTAANEALTGVGAEGSDNIFAGVWTQDLSERLTISAAGAIEYIGTEPATITFESNGLLDPASGSNHKYDLYYQVELFGGGTSRNLLSRMPVNVDAANPAPFTLLSKILLNTGDKVRHIAVNINNTTDFTISGPTVIGS